jgi:glucan phosphoethanolaminetransferase (alkaline phosphatase superfamily)
MLPTCIAVLKASQDQLLVGRYRSIVLLILLLGVFFLPTFVALGRKYSNRATIFLVNVLLGLTIVGWIVALFYAFTAPDRERSSREISRSRSPNVPNDLSEVTHQAHQ